MQINKTKIIVSTLLYTCLLMLLYNLSVYANKRTYSPSGYLNRLKYPEYSDKTELTLGEVSFAINDYTSYSSQLLHTESFSRDSEQELYTKCLLKDRANRLISLYNKKNPEKSLPSLR